ncbi:hypothetical protein DL95DRAFT_307762 [Leptodontidium sp. 2 PMI_412]|nr:hypothetical protein DL95DRAFT_307762 [Leptodontidium sp. 2 PMI_412]
MIHLTRKQADWPNGKALDYESRDCRFDPCVGHSIQFEEEYNYSFALVVYGLSPPQFFLAQNGSGDFSSSQDLKQVKGEHFFLTNFTGGICSCRFY